jgi:hypothetical protein
MNSFRNRPSKSVFQGDNGKCPTMTFHWKLRDTHSGPWGGRRWQHRPYRAVKSQLQPAASCGRLLSATLGSLHSSKASSSAHHRVPTDPPKTDLSDSA